MLKAPFSRHKDIDIRKVTPAGYASLEARLKQMYLDRQAIRQHMHELREQQASDGYDLSDTVSALYNINAEIDDLKTTLSQVVVIDPESKKNHKVAQVGATIHLESSGRSISYQLVDSLEADPSNGKISSDSPLGRALIGKRINQLVHFMSPSLGLLKFKITKVQ